MMLVKAKFSEIVKVGETIEWFENGMSFCFCVTGSAGLLKKKREDVSAVSYEGKKTPRRPSSYQGRPRPS